MLQWEKKNSRTFGESRLVGKRSQHKRARMFTIYRKLLIGCYGSARKP